MMQDNSTSLISIIVPVFQVAPFLRACLDSILCQSYHNWELILIDDGSTDGSNQICDEYSLTEKRIHVIHQNNQGLSAARNRGLDAAKGEYITFVDSDDVLLNPDYLIILLATLEDTNSQISVCGSISFPENGPPPEPVEAFYGTRIFSGREILLGNNVSCSGYYPFACTARLFRSCCYKHLRFPIGISSEDDAIAAQLLLDIDRVSYSGLALYGYRSRLNSIVHRRGSFQYYKDQCFIADLHRKFYISRGESELAKLVEEKQWYNHLNLLFFGRDQSDPEYTPPIYCLDPARTIRHCNRHSIWNLICQRDPDRQSVYAELFLQEELHRVRIMMALSRSFFHIGKKTPWIFLDSDIDNMINLAQDERLAVILSKELRSYEELPDAHRTKCEAIETRAIITTLRAKRICLPAKFEALYAHPWFREPREETQAYLADLLEAFLLISTNNETNDQHDLDHLVRYKFHNRYDMITRLHDLLFARNPLDADLRQEEAAFLLEILKSHAVAV